MKIVATIVVLLACCALAGAQTPENIAATRWLLPGSPRITDIVSVADGKVTKTIWFAAHDSIGIGTMTVPTKFVPAAYTEYKPDMPGGSGPTRIAYAEKAFSVQDTAKKKPAKYKPQVWFIDGYQPISSLAINGDAYLFALTPPAKKGSPYGMLAYPLPTIPVNVTFTVGLPSTLQWSAASKNYPASLWFLGYNTYPSPYTNLYSFTPQKKPTSPYGMTVTEYTFPSFPEVILAAHVEDGLIWTVGILNGGSYMWLNMIPAGGSGNGLRWQIPATIPTNSPLDVIPVYTSRKPGEGVMPNQVWIRTQQNLTVLALAATTDTMTTDSAYFVSSPTPFKFFMGVGADNGAKADTGKKVVVFTEGPSTTGPMWTVNMSFLQAGVPTVSGIQRHGITASTASEVVGAIAIPNVPSYTATVQPASLGGAPTYALTYPWLKSEWDFPYTGMFQNISAPFFTNVHPVGYMDTKKFDLVFAQTGGDALVGTTPSDPTISRITGTFSKPAKTAADLKAPFSRQPLDDTHNEMQLAKPLPFELKDAYPNPFNPTTTIGFTLPEDAVVTLRIYNMLGQEVQSLFNRESMAGGEHEVQFNASRLASGVYFYHIDAGRYSATKKLMLVK
jgi:hypothetical protein